MIINLTPQTFIETHNDWLQLFNTFNWYTFTLINIEFENDNFTHGYEFIFIILGLGFRVRHNKKSFDMWRKTFRSHVV